MSALESPPATLGWWLHLCVGVLPVHLLFDVVEGEEVEVRRVLLVDPSAQGITIFPRTQVTFISWDLNLLRWTSVCRAGLD